jgi:hypothetical protein
MTTEYIALSVERFKGLVIPHRAPALRGEGRRFCFGVSSIDLNVFASLECLLCSFLRGLHGGFDNRRASYLSWIDQTLFRRNGPFRGLTWVIGVDFSVGFATPSGRPLSAH